MHRVSIDGGRVNQPQEPPAYGASPVGDSIVMPRLELPLITLREAKEFQNRIYGEQPGVVKWGYGQAPKQNKVGTLGCTPTI